MDEVSSRESGLSLSLPTLRAWIQERRAFLLKRREEAQDEKKEIFSALLRELSEFEVGIIQGFLLNPSNEIRIADAFIIPENYEIMGALLLRYLNLPPVSIKQFRNNHWREDLVRRYPEKKEQIQIMNRFACENTLIKTLISMQNAQKPNLSLFCPKCKRQFRYRKSLVKHIANCNRSMARE